MRMQPCAKPLGELERADALAVVTASGWRVDGYYVGDEYYERAVRPGDELWYRAA